MSITIGCYVNWITAYFEVEALLHCSGNQQSLILYERQGCNADSILTGQLNGQVLI